MSDNMREFETINRDGEAIKLYLRPVNYSISRSCDIEAKKAWAECLNMGVKTQAALEHKLRENGIWTSKEENQIRDLQARAAVLLAMMEESEKAKRFKQSQELALKAANIRNLIHELYTIKQQAFQNSCEGISSEVRYEAYIAYATVYADDSSKLYWKNYKDFIENREEQAALDAIRRYQEILSNENLDIMKGYPENQILVKHGLMTKNLQARLSRLKEIEEEAKQEAVEKESEEPQEINTDNETKK